MPGIKRVGRKKERFEEILQQAASLFRERGYHGVTMDDIAEGLGLSKLSIYYYFESKESILYIINDLAHTKNLKNLKGIVNSEDSPETKLRQAIKNHVSILLSELSPATAALREEHSLLPENRKKLIRKRDRYDQMIRGIISEGIKKGVFIECDPKMAWFVIVGAVSHILNWYSPEGPLTKEQIGDFFAEFLIRMLLVSPPPVLPVDKNPE